MLSESEIEAKLVEIGGDGLYMRGHTVKAGVAWEIMLKPPPLQSWEAYCAHRNDPAAQFALVQAMNAWCASDVVVTNGDARAAFMAVRSRFVGVAEAITNSAVFQRFIGLEAHEFEK